jgi:drug/metabolite transporter (DMT)-like permease
MNNRVGLGIACALGATLFYGLVPNFVRGALNNGVAPVDSTLFRTAFIGIVSGGLAAVRGEAFRIPADRRLAFAAQCLATLGVSVGYLASVQFIPVGLAVMIFYSFPVMIMLAAPLVEGHAPGLSRLAIAAIAFAGLGVAVGPTFDSLDIRGILLATAASVSCAIQFFSGRSLGRSMTPAAFGSLVHLAILPLTLAIAAWVGGGSIGVLTGTDATGLGLICMSGVALVYVVGYLTHMISLRFAPASTIAPFYNLEPIVAIAVAAIFLGERLTSGQYVGGGMVLAALVASGFAERRKDA